MKLVKKQRDIIEEQKQKVDQAFEGLEQAHKEIHDSINYDASLKKTIRYG